MQIELLHPIHHGVGKVAYEFSRGLHDVADELAMEFLKIKGADGTPIARLPEDKTIVPKGSVVTRGPGGVRITPLRAR